MRVRGVPGDLFFEILPRRKGNVRKEFAWRQMPTPLLADFRVYPFSTKTSVACQWDLKWLGICRAL